MSVTWGYMREMSVAEAIIANILKGVILLGVLVGIGHCQTPKPVEHDPGAWAATTVFTSTVTGSFTKPWVGFVAGTGVGVLSNLQDSTHARQNIVGSVAGAAVGYVIIKTLKHDWNHRRER